MTIRPLPAFPPASRLRAGTGRVTALLAVVALAGALVAPALWNGYPLLYFDTVDYVSFGYTWKLPIYRTAGYGFLALAGWLVDSVWPTLFIQAAITAYVLFESWRWLVPELRGWRLALVLAFTLSLTSLPWVTSVIMPDVYTGPAVLLTLILALHGERMPPLRRFGCIFLLGIACMTHPTHVTMVAGLAICIVVLNWLESRGWAFMPMRAGGVVAGLVIGLVFSLGTNWLATGRVFLAPRTTPLLTFAVMFEQGLGERYLAETCGQPGEHQSLLCPYREELPADANQFLWHNPAFWKAGGWNVLVPAAGEDLSALISRYPLDFAVAAARLMAEQLVVIRTGEGFRTMVGFVDGQIRQFYPGDYAQFLAARQQGYPEMTDSPIPSLNRVHVPVMLAGLALLMGVVVIALVRRERLTATVGGMVLLAYLGNAFICGAVSNPADRYGSRLAWLAALTALALLPRLFMRAARETPSAAG